jgi:hypothetical protein
MYYFLPNAIAKETTAVVRKEQQQYFIVYLTLKLAGLFIWLTDL